MTTRSTPRSPIVTCSCCRERRQFDVTRPRGAVSDVGNAGRELFAREEPGSRAAFVRAAAEHLPFSPSRFEVVICRLALPYTDNARALAEMARVLTSGGTLILKIHHARFYTLELREALRTGRARSAIHACRVLLAGCLYHLTGSQPRGRLTGGEPSRPCGCCGGSSGTTACR